MSLGIGKLVKRSTASAAVLAMGLTSVPAAPAYADGKRVVQGLLILGVACAISGACKSKEGSKSKGGGPAGPSDAIAMNSSERRLIQEGLAAKGFYTGAIDGAIGRGSRAAIRAYQASEGAKQTGYLTAAQINALAAAAPSYARLPAGSPMLFGADLARDTTSDELRALQAALNAVGFDAGSPDGRMGSRTRTAVTAYKAKHGLAGKPVPSKRLLARLSGVPVMAEAGGAGLGSVDLAEEDRDGPALDDGQGMAVAALEIEEPGVDPIYAEPEVAPAVSEHFSILGMRTGMARAEIEEVGLEALGEETLIDAGTVSLEHEMLDLSHVMVQQNWPEPGSEVIMSLYSSDKPDLGALVLIRTVAIGEDMTKADFKRDLEPSLLDAYGKDSRIDGSLNWIGEESVRDAVLSGEAEFGQCGAFELDPSLAAASAEDIAFSGPAIPTIVIKGGKTVSQKCGNALSVTFADGLLQIGVWNSDALIGEEVGSVLEGIKF